MTPLYAALRDLLPPEVALAAGSHEQVPGGLIGDETRLVQGAVEKRTKEFRAGRAAARMALSELGHEPTAILKRTDRTPIWPQGIVGSISHSRSHVAAIVANDDAFAGLGVDIEPDTPMENALVDRLLLPEERGRDGSAKLKFSIKEAGFKALYPQFGRFIEFHQAITMVDQIRGEFTIDILLDDWAGPHHLTGRYAVAEGHCISVVLCPV